jgi:hypothetical protein
VNTRAEFIPLTEQSTQTRLFHGNRTVCALFAKVVMAGLTQTEDKCMKHITMAAMMIAGAGLLASTAPAATPVVASRSLQQSCTAAPAVARTYLADQVSAGHKLTMSRAAAIAEVTKITGGDGEFAGLKPCDSGYPNAVRFYLDEVIKAGTNNSTP